MNRPIILIAFLCAGLTAQAQEYPGGNFMLADELDARLPLNCDVLNMFHSNIEDTTKSLPIIKSKWSGPIGVYPEAGRRDYVRAFADPNVDNPYSTEEYVTIAQDWVAHGVQVIGGCCGMGLPYIQALKDKLPEAIPVA